MATDKVTVTESWTLVSNGPCIVTLQSKCFQLWTNEAASDTNATHWDVSPSLQFAQNEEKPIYMKTFPSNPEVVVTVSNKGV